MISVSSPLFSANRKERLRSCVPHNLRQVLKRHNFNSTNCYTAQLITGQFQSHTMTFFEFLFPMPQTVFFSLLQISRSDGVKWGGLFYGYSYCHDGVRLCLCGTSPLRGSLFSHQIIYVWVWSSGGMIRKGKWERLWENRVLELVRLPLWLTNHLRHWHGRGRSDTDTMFNVHRTELIPFKLLHVESVLLNERTAPQTTRWGHSAT